MAKADTKESLRVRIKHAVIGAANEQTPQTIEFLRKVRDGEEMDISIGMDGKAKPVPAGLKMRIEAAKLLSAITIGKVVPDAKDKQSQADESEWEKAEKEYAEAKKLVAGGGKILTITPARGENDGDKG